MTESRGQLADALAGRYLLEEPLGRGASATVYLAQDVRHGRRGALKVLRAALGRASSASSLPSWITPAELTSDPLWAPLRVHPGFATLTANHALTVTRRLVH